MPDDVKKIKREPCPNCDAVICYHMSHCERCGRFVGYPNVWSAERQAKALRERYEAVLRRPEEGWYLESIKHIREIAGHARPVISMSIKIVRDIMQNGRYKNYHKRIDIGERPIAKSEDEANRGMVGTKLFPGYHRRVYYASLSPDGRGLTSYGGAAVCWNVEANFLEPRISVHEENSFVFFDKHGLGQLRAKIPEGYRGVWCDRSKLAVAKIGPNLSSSLTQQKISEMFFKNESDRDKDVFIEIAIYHEYGLDKYHIHSVRLEALPNSEEEKTWLQDVREMCAKQEVTFHDISQ